MDKINILSYSIEDLEDYLQSVNEKKFRAKQIFDWLHIRRVEDFKEMTNLSISLRNILSEKFFISYPRVVKKLVSNIDGTIKYLFELDDMNHIETVLMDYKHGNSLCISTQVGCKMGCNFCASTIAGFKRNLMPSEMLGQIYMAEKESGKKVESLVLMGIGEPLDNFDNVVKFLQLLSCPEGKNLSLRHVSLSTCGLVDGIKKLQDFKFGLTLSISLHSTTDEKRSAIMPVNKRYNIDTLINACKDYIQATGRRISFEYSVIDGVNNSSEDAKRLISLVKGMNCHINLIPVNEIKERDYHSDRNSVVNFQHMLEKGGLNVTIRRTLGSDINAACGQLRREYEI